MKFTVLALTVAVKFVSALGIRQQILRFTENGTFQIAVFSDLHYGEAEDEDSGPQRDTNSTQVMNTILDAEKPQLAVLNGDLISGEDTNRENSSTYLDQVVAPLVSRDVLWASTYGNHDSDYDLSRLEIFAREKRYRNSLTQSMVSMFSSDSGVSNYYLPVYSADKSDNAPKVILWFFDSRGGNEFQQKKHGHKVTIGSFVDQSVVDWFTSTRDELNNIYNQTIPSLAFFHIPITAMLAYQQDPGVDANTEPGINYDSPLGEQGPSDGSLDYKGQDKPFMQALVETNGLIATFSGHDHGDDWCFKWNSTLSGLDTAGGNGVVLCFNRHSGYGGYGSWTRGSRQILLREQTLGSQTDTWIRLEDSSISGAVTLNATYGEDSYPAVQDTTT